MLPETFEFLLNHRVAPDPDHGYRVRWSNAHQTWQIEQKMGRGAFDPHPGNPDDMLRARDGYDLVAEITPLPKVRCDTCHFWIEDIPFGKWSEVRCSYCYQVKQEKSMFFVGYFPFSDKLVEYFEKTSPKRTLERKREREEADRLKMKAWKRDSDNRLEAILHERHSSIVGINSWGYTGAYRAVA